MDSLSAAALCPYDRALAWGCCIIRQNAMALGNMERGGGGCSPISWRVAKKERSLLSLLDPWRAVSMSLTMLVYYCGATGGGAHTAGG